MSPVITMWVGSLALHSSTSTAAHRRNPRPCQACLGTSWLLQAFQGGAARRLL